MTPLPITKSQGGHVQPHAPKKKAAWTAPPDWKQRTAAKWASTHQEQIAAAGQPKMQSAHEIQAKANADAWKSIMQMQSALPTPDQIGQQFGAQRNAILPLIEGHRNWLQKAGEYQVNQTNAISQMTQGAAQAGDQQATAGAAAAGAPAGAGFAGNVDPAQVAMPAASYGTSLANYFHALVPYANSIGGGALDKVNQGQNDAMQSLGDARKQIALKLPEIQADNFTTGYGNALNEYKSELAALVQSQKGGGGGMSAGESGRLAESKRYHNEQIALAKDRNAISGRRADAAIKLGEEKGTVKKSNGSSLRLILNTMNGIYDKKGGEEVPGAYSVTMVKKAYKASGISHPEETYPITGATPEEVRKRVKAFLADSKHQPLTEGVYKGLGKWNQKGPANTPVKGSKKTVGQAGEYTRRMNAWRYLVAQNKGLPDPMTTADLQDLFRTMHPKTK